MKIDITELEKRIEEGNLRKQKHPTLDLYIYNYTDQCAYNKAWDDYTRICRGLVLDLEGNVIARAFDKFFNLGEADVPNTDPKTLQEITKEHGDFVITEKVDGSLGILFNYQNEWICATRGSFNSEQSVKMQDILYRTIVHHPKQPGRKSIQEYTHLFEIIYPENRIVVNYGDQEKLVYLGSTDLETGEIIDHPAISEVFETPKTYEAMVDNIPNAEGYVLWFKDGYKLKVKFEEYKRLHRIVTGLNVRSVWEMLANGQSFEEILKDVPDEFYKWLDKNIKQLKKQYRDIEKEAKNDFDKIQKNLYVHFTFRKEFAQEAVRTKYPALMFAMYDMKDYRPMIWKLIKPSGDLRFKNIDNE